MHRRDTACSQLRSHLPVRLQARIKVLEANRGGPMAFELSTPGLVRLPDGEYKAAPPVGTLALGA